MHRESTPASSADTQRPGNTDRPGFFRPWRPSFGTASGLASIISQLLKREDPRLLAQDAAIKTLALLNARKAILFHRKNDLLAELAAASFSKDRPRSLISAELRAVTTEILSIG